MNPIPRRGDEEAGSMSEWQPIETAPMEPGSFVEADWSGRSRRCRMQWVKNWGWYATPGSLPECATRATHWRPAVVGASRT
jgi:hypothetical protein